MHSKKQIVYGFTIPEDIRIFFINDKVSEYFFNVERSGNSIIFTSGCSNIPTKDQINKYNFEDCRIK